MEISLKICTFFVIVRHKLLRQPVIIERMKIYHTVRPNLGQLPPKGMTETLQNDDVDDDAFTKQTVNTDSDVNIYYLCLQKNM